MTPSEFVKVEQLIAIIERAQRSREEQKLRDAFAAGAMQGILAADPKGNFTFESIAIAAYRMADAMLEARKQ